MAVNIVIRLGIEMIKVTSHPRKSIFYLVLTPGISASPYRMPIHSPQDAHRVTQNFLIKEEVEILCGFRLTNNT